MVYNYLYVFQAGDILKILEKAKENKLFFITFIVMMVNSVVTVYDTGLNNLMQSYYASLYVVNYSCGYSSRLLVGSVFSLFFKDKLSYETIVTVLLIVYFLLCLSFSLFINKYLKLTKYEHLKIYIIFMTATPFITGILDFLGVVDIFWPFIMMFCLWAIDKKGVRWLVPFVCVIGIAIHEYFTVTYMVPCAIMIYHQFAKKPNTANLIYVVFSAIVLSAASYYFLFIGSETMKMSLDELIVYINGRANLGNSVIDEFYIKDVFFWRSKSSLIFENTTSTYLDYIKYIPTYLTANNTFNLMSVVYFFLSLCIIFSPVVYILAKTFKAEKSPFKKLTWLLSFTPFLLGLFCQVISTDDTRFMFHYIVITTVFIFFMFKENDEAFITSYYTLTKKIENPFAAVSAVLVAGFLFSGVVS